jgi:predicted ribosome quality control (RQC) complex YloA/Tae2 family protein
MLKTNSRTINDSIEFLLQNNDPKLKEDECLIAIKYSTMKKLDNYNISGDYDDLINKMMEKALKSIEIERENEKLKKEIQRLKRKLKENEEPYIHPMGYYG